MADATIIEGNCLDSLKAMKSNSVHCIVTSPPYYGLRTYGGAPVIWDGSGDYKCEHVWGKELPPHHPGQVKDNKAVHNENAEGQSGGSGNFCQICGAWKGELGIEPTPDLYVVHLALILSECRRVLRDDGVLWLNLGDSYNSSNGFARNKKGESSWYRDGRENGAGDKKLIEHSVVKEKDLFGIPWRMAFALQGFATIPIRDMQALFEAIDERDFAVIDDIRDNLAMWDKLGKYFPYWIRMDVIWDKVNPMPESVKDRPTKSHEYIFMLTKSKRYYYDAEAVAELTSSGSEENPVTKNLRSVWRFSTRPFAEAHFATFPPELPERCIRASTSDKGCCVYCEAPWERVTKKILLSNRKDANIDYCGSLMYRGGTHNSGLANNEKYLTKTVGWRPTCHCFDKAIFENDGFFSGDKGAEWWMTDNNIGAFLKEHTRLPLFIPSTVLDVFSGAGTTGVAALELGRNYIGLEINEDYVEMSKKRLEPYLQRQRLF